MGEGTTTSGSCTLAEVLAYHLRTEYGSDIIETHGSALISVSELLFIEILPTRLRIFGTIYPYRGHEFELADPTGLDRALEFIRDVVSENQNIE